ncbi:TadE/TadG family type IV pilus assembly protein [Massilia sp. TWR1-2-2]|uniref:TadE/TadG family type IV pilus assembly protein n=1 Tax=Massilia sp. TWR1-2-2 TaxID=2804584 RepID=UPI003CE8A0EA
MKKSVNRPEGLRQHGVAAVELAIIIPILMMLVAVPFFLGRVLWHYSVAEKAAHDAARYLSSVPVTEMKSQSRIAAVVDVARQIYELEVAELNPGLFPATPTFLCGGITCAGLFVPDTVRVNVQMRVFADFITTETVYFTDEEGGFVLNADVTLPYVGK